eukprot:scaffold3784_cov174-Amphora_coffeaeformis.AAC.10
MASCRAEPAAEVRNRISGGSRPSQATAGSKFRSFAFRRYNVACVSTWKENLRANDGVSNDKDCSSPQPFFLSLPRETRTSGRTRGRGED